MTTTLLTESIGYLAAALVLAAFCMRDIVALRWLAIASNLAFITYGALADLRPVLVLHLLLLPINVLQLLRARRFGRILRRPCSATSSTPCAPRSFRSR